MWINRALPTSATSNEEEEEEEEDYLLLTSTYIFSHNGLKL